jgi:hypothetical protein
MLAQIKKRGKAFWSDIEGRSTLLHLLVATLHGIGSTLSGISESMSIKKMITARLAIREEDMNALLMIVLDGVLEHLARQRAWATGWISQAHPRNSWIGTLGIGLYAKDRFWMRSREQSGYGWWLWLICATKWKLACSHQEMTNQQRSKKNQTSSLHVSLRSSSHLPFATERNAAMM